MGGYITIGPASEIDEGGSPGFDVEGARVDVARVGGALYAFSDVCTHQGCPLAEGDLSGTELECECHGSVFDVTTGEVLEGPAAAPIEVYPAREVDGQIQIEV